MNGDAMQLLANLIGPEDFADLLVELPDEFFDLNEKGRTCVWKKILQTINRKRMSSRELAKIADEIVKVLVVVDQDPQLYTV